LILYQYFILTSFIKARSAVVLAREASNDHVWISNDFTVNSIISQASDAKSAEKFDSKRLKDNMPD
jgi:hypothetical protein